MFISKLGTIEGRSDASVVYHRKHPLVRVTAAGDFIQKLGAVRTVDAMFVHPVAEIFVPSSLPGDWQSIYFPPESMVKRLTFQQLHEPFGRTGSSKFF